MDEEPFLSTLIQFCRKLHFPSRRSIILAMQEILSRTGDAKAPLRDQEFYELRLEDSDDIWRPGFIVKQTRAQWSEIDQQIMWEEPEWERWPTLKKANEKYEARRQALIAKGFIHSNMDLF